MVTDAAEIVCSMSSNRQGERVDDEMKEEKTKAAGDRKLNKIVVLSYN